MTISHTEENYLKAIYKINEQDGKSANTNAISAAMQTTAASVTDMLKRLSDKNLIHYEKYKGVTLSSQGDTVARSLIRKHRLWESFLVEKLQYNWDECHDIAEQLEHIQSHDLIDRLDSYLGHPKFDPHGDPIPDAEGNFTPRQQTLLSEMALNDWGIIVGVREHASAFLQYLDRQSLGLGAKVQILEIFDFDGSIKILRDDTETLIVSGKVSANLYLKK